MVICTNNLHPHRHQQAALLFELLLAMTIFVLVMIPITVSFLTDQKVCRAEYYRAVAMEIVDGEMEILRVGEWREFNEGPQNYSVRSDAAKNLPAGKFLLTREKQHLRLEWRPDIKIRGVNVVREIDLELQ